MELIRQIEAEQKEPICPSFPWDTVRVHYKLLKVLGNGYRF